MPSPNLAPRLAIASTPSLLLSMLLLAPAGAQDLAVKGGRIIPIVGEPIEDGVILIRDGRIEAVGADLEVPIEARVVDATGKVVLPGFVEPHSAAPLVASNEVNANVPFVTVVDAIDPGRTYFEDALRNGVTTVGVVPGNSTMIGGRAAVIKTAGTFADDMVLKRDAGLKLSLQPARGRSRMSHLARLRAELDETRRLIEELDEDEEDADDEDADEPDEGEDADESDDEDDDRATQDEDDEEEDADESDEEGEGDEEGDEPEIDIRREAMIALLRGELPAFLYCGRALDVPHALSLIEEYDLDATLVLGPACYKAADLVAESGLPVILDPQLVFWETDPRTLEDERIVLPEVYREAGVPITLQVDPGFASLGRNFFWYQAATLVKHGTPVDEALEALTIRPARLLGVDEFVGSIEEGKDADLVILTGEPLQLETWVDTTIVDGEVAYRRAEDERLQELLRPSDD